MLRSNPIRHPMRQATASLQFIHKAAPGLINLPIPPLSLPSAKNAYHVGETVLITMNNGSRVKGALLAFRADRGAMFVRLDSDTRIVAKEMPFSSIRSLHILRDRRIVSLSPTLEVRGKVIIPPIRQEFEIVLQDDERLAGHTFSFRVDRNGLHLFPGEESGVYTHLFVPSHAIKAQRVGPLLGEALVEENLVTYDAMKAELAEQHRLRERPIGEYLISASLVTAEQLEAALERQRAMPQVKLGEVLVRDGVITETQLGEALQEQERNRRMPLGEMLISAGLVSAEHIKQTLAKKIGIPYIDLRGFEIDVKAVDLLGEEIVRRHQAIPLYFQDGRMVVAIEDPMRWEAIETLRTYANMDVEPVMATASDIAWAVDKYYGSASA